jgi:hypothetical protein
MASYNLRNNSRQPTDDLHPLTPELTDLVEPRPGFGAEEDEEEDIPTPMPQITELPPANAPIAAGTFQQKTAQSIGSSNDPPQSLDR